jgi:hypothetical protein
MDVLGITSKNSIQLNGVIEYVLSLFNEVRTDLFDSNKSTSTSNLAEVFVIAFENTNHFKRLYNNSVKKNKPVLLIQFSKEKTSNDLNIIQEKLAQQGITIWGTYLLPTYQASFNLEEGIVNTGKRLELIRIINRIIYTNMQRRSKGASCGINRFTREYGDESDY